MLDVLNKIGLIVGFLMLLGAAFAVAKGSFNKSRIEALREDNTDLRNRVVDLESEVARLKTSDAAHLEVEAAMQSKIDFQQEMITSRADVEKVDIKVGQLIRILNAHHEQAMSKLDIAIAAWEHKNG